MRVSFGKETSNRAFLIVGTRGRTAERMVIVL